MITVATYNTMSVVHREEVTKSLSKINEIAQSEGGNFFVGLQEVRNSKTNPNIRSLISSVFGTHHTEFLLRDEFSLHDLGIVLVSGIKPRKVTMLELPKLRGWFWKTLFSLKGGVPQYGSIIGEYEVRGVVVTVVVLHLDVFGGRKQRVAQVEAIKNTLRQFNTDHCIVMGDFNTRDAESVRGLFGDEFVLWGNQGKHTVSIENAINPEIPGSKLVQKMAVRTGFDFSFRSDWTLTKNLKLVSEGVEYTCFGSDHYPVWAVFDFKS